jgi:cyclase
MPIARVIPVLLLRNRDLVKTLKFKDEKYVGDPINAVKIFNDKEVDELIVADINASRENNGPDFDFLKELSSECFMPLAYAGGVRSLDHIQKLIQSGIEKIVLNSILLDNINFVKEASDAFGSSTIVAGIDVKRNLFGKYKVFNHRRNITTSLDPLDFALRLQQLGAGELFLNNVDLDGTMAGYDLQLTKSITDQLSIPLIACGGCGNLTHIKAVLTQANAAAAAAGSFFVFHGPHKAVLITYPSRAEIGAIIDRSN